VTDCEAFSSDEQSQNPATRRNASSTIAAQASEFVTISLEDKIPGRTLRTDHRLMNKEKPGIKDKVVVITGASRRNRQGHVKLRTW
jgi:hypothetical protein